MAQGALASGGTAASRKRRSHSGRAYLLLTTTPNVMGRETGPRMRRQRLGPLVLIVAGIVVFVGLLIGVATALGVGLIVFGGLAILGHIWFRTWGPSSEPNRFHRRELWENKRRVHKGLRHQPRQPDES